MRFNIGEKLYRDGIEVGTVVGLWIHREMAPIYTLPIVYPYGAHGGNRALGIHYESSEEFQRLDILELQGRKVMVTDPERNQAVLWKPFRDNTYEITQFVLSEFPYITEVEVEWRDSDEV